jgi:hypothetical protein
MKMFKKIISAFKIKDKNKELGYPWATAFDMGFDPSHKGLVLYAKFGSNEITKHYLMQNIESKKISWVSEHKIDLSKFDYINNHGSN